MYAFFQTIALNVRHVVPLGHIIPTQWRRMKYQFHSLWFDPTEIEPTIYLTRKRKLTLILPSVCNYNIKL